MLLKKYLTKKPETHHAAAHSTTVPQHRSGSSRFHQLCPDYSTALSWQELHPFTHWRRTQGGHGRSGFMLETWRMVCLWIMDAPSAVLCSPHPSHGAHTAPSHCNTGAAQQHFGTSSTADHREGIPPAPVVVPEALAAGGSTVCKVHVVTDEVF